MTRPEPSDDSLTHAIIGVFYTVYNTLGYGFLEQVYLAALTHELRSRGHEVICEAAVDVWYKNIMVARQRVDLLIDRRIIVELKSTERLAPTARRQLYNYLRATRLDAGLLLHFGPEPRFDRVAVKEKGNDMRGKRPNTQDRTNDSHLQ